MNGNMIGQAPTHILLVYPLHDSSLDLTVDGTVGPFNITQLNQYLVNAERCEVTSGQFYHATVQMHVKDGDATTYVEPIYNHFKLKILPTDPADPRDIEESVKTFVANTLILRDDDPDEDGGPPVTATTSLQRAQSEEFFQFLWFAIRKSLGTVVGGFK